MRQIYVESYFKGFKKLVNYSLLKDHPQKDVIERRLKIIDFFDAYGKEATKDAFQVSRSTVYLWKKKLKDSEGKVSFLAPKSKAPRRVRKRVTNPLITQFVKDYRPKHPGVGKEAIKPELDEYLKEMGIPSISESTIGRIVKDLKQRGLIPDLSSKLTYRAKEDKFYEKAYKRRRKKLRRRGYLPQKLRRPSSNGLHYPI